MIVPFNTPDAGHNELELMAQAIACKHVSGCGGFTKKAEALLTQQLNATGSIILTTSCTHALEMAAILLELKPGDEVIFPSYTFVSTALAFTMHGAKPVFADITADTLNLNVGKLEALITKRTRAIVPVHYAGVGCDMDQIMALAEKYQLVVIEDNAHGLYGKYKQTSLGTIGHMATQSFHETKNITCGEGGALIINDPCYQSRAEIIRDKGTDRSRFYRGEVDKYTWVDKGSSYCLSDMLAAFLLAQLQRADTIQPRRRAIWQHYNRQLSPWAQDNNVLLPFVPDHCQQAYHMFYLLLPDPAERERFLRYLNGQGILAVFHYIPLHDSPMTKKLNPDQQNCPVATNISQRIVRLPFFQMNKETQEQVINVVKGYQS